jgi:hypothetical protein
MLVAIPVITQVSAAEASGRGSSGRSLRATGVHNHRISRGDFQVARGEAIERFISDPRHRDSMIEIRGIPAANPSEGHQVKTIERNNDDNRELISVTDGDIDSSTDALARGVANVRIFSGEQFRNWFRDWQASISGGTIEARVAYDSNANPDKENIQP